MNEKTLLFVICVEAIIYLLLYSLHDCTFKSADISVRRFARLTENERLLPSTKSCGKMWYGFGLNAGKSFFVNVLF